MKSRLVSNLQDSNDDFSTADGDMNFGAFVLGSHTGGGEGILSNLAPATPVAPVLPDESVEAMAAVSGSGTGGPGSVVAETSSSGFTINLVFDSAAMAAPASFRAGIEQAAAILSATITNKITVNLDIDYSGTGGGAAAGPDNGQFVNYSTVRADLVANAAAGDTSFNALPTGTTIQGQSQVAVWNAQLKLFGLLSPNSTTTDDGSATFATDINPNLLVGVALHELTHAIGRVPYGSQPDIFDFYRFTSAGTRLFTDNIPASSAYFSLDGGNTKLADFGVSSDPSDFLNAPGSNLTPNDAFDEFYSNNTLQSLTSVDLKMLDALGFNTMPSGLAVVANTAQALQGGAAVSLLTAAPSINGPGSTTLSGATIKIANAGGNAVAGDELLVNGIQNGALSGVTASWNATTDTLTLSGTASASVYDTLLSEITYQDTGTDTSSGNHPIRTVTWSINDGTNSYTTTSQVTVDRAPVTVNNTANDTIGATVATTTTNGVLSNATDLDSDSLTITAVSDIAHGAGTVGTSLAGTYGHVTLNANGSYSYVADNTAAINSGATGSHLQDVFGYTVSDGHGGIANASLTVTLDRAPAVATSNVTLSAGNTTVAVSSLFTATDPDGNSITTYAFENTGPGHFVLNGSVVEPNNQEIDVSAAQLSQLTYQSTAGSVDTLEVRVNDGTLWSNWTSFTVTPTELIQTDGSTSLVESGANFVLNPDRLDVGTELYYGGSAVTAGEFGTWTPIGAVQVAGGYDIAWHDTSSGLYTVWSTDANGNYLSNLIPASPGSSSAVESIETVFNQDLNGDSTIGAPTVLIHNDGTTKFVEVGNNYFLDPASGGSGPELHYGGSVVTAGEFGTWTPIGAVQVAGGYDVAWHDPSSGLYTVWSTDSNGNYLSNLIGAGAGNSAALEAIETTFNQDLNGDGTIGIPKVVIQTDGTTALTEVGTNYFLNPTGGGTGPELHYGGSVVTAGEFGTWTPIGAVQVAGGYDVAWHDPSSGLYTVWNTDSNGNYLSNLTGAGAGSSAALEAIETTFNQDLNGDGTIGIPKVVIQTDGTTALTAVGTNYFLNPTGGGTGAELHYGGSVVTAGEFGTWTPIGAVQVAGGGYDVAWHDPSSGLYTVWSADSNGNYLSNLIGAVAGNNAALEAIETLFNQDLNGDSHIGIYVAPGTTLQVTSPLPNAVGAATIGAGATLELGTPDSASITFNSSTGMLKLDSLTVFTGVIDNFTGNGSLSGSDQIDLKGINLNSVHDSYSNGVLTVTDGTNTTALDFSGTYVLANFKFASDGSGGTILYDPPVPAQPQSSGAVGHTASINAAAFFASAGQDSFVFAPASGHNSATVWNPTMDAQQSSLATSLNVAAFSWGSHDGTHGHAFMVDSPHDAMPIHPLTEAQLHAHLDGFHIV